MVSRFEQFTGAIFHINRCVQKIERMEMGKFQLKGPHAQCLLAMSRFPDGITASRLTEICDKDKAAISRTVTDLEGKGLIRRQDRNGNRYRALLTLTQRGREAAEQVYRRAGLAVERASEGMTEAERTVLYRALALIAGNLRQICTDGLEESFE